MLIYRIFHKMCTWMWYALLWLCYQFLWTSVIAIPSQLALIGWYNATIIWPMQCLMSFISLISDKLSNCFLQNCLTHWSRVTHICVSKLTIIGSDNGLWPGRRQAINWTNAGILLIEPLGTNFSEILIGIQTFSFKKMHMKMSSAKGRFFSLGLSELNKSSL